MARTMAMAAAAVMAILLLPPGQADARSTEEHPHGLPYESPLALSPAAYEFFHPSARRERARQAHGVAPAPATMLAPRRGPQQLRESVVRGASSASVARADQEEGGVAPVDTVRSGGFRAGKVAGVLAGAAAVALVALGVAYAVARRRLARGGGTEAAGAPKSNA